MYRTVPYIVLFLILALLQIFLFDNLSISIYLCPLVYIGFIVLLPIDAPPVAVLFLALSMSVAMDWAMGAAGINTIATLPVAMLRRPLLQSVCGKEGIREGGIPSSIHFVIFRRSKSDRTLLSSILCGSGICLFLLFLVDFLR